MVRFKADEWKRLAEQDADFALVGIFVQNRPSIDEVRKEFQNLFRIEGEAHVGAIHLRSILLRFSSKVDCLCVLERGQAMVTGRRVRFVRWTPDWSRKMLLVVPVWI